MQNRSVTPTKKSPTVNIKNISLDTLSLFLQDGELLVSKGYPAPPPKTKEIRKCESCHGVYIIAEKTSLKTCCGYCTSHTF